MHVDYIRGTQRQFSENICSEDDLRSRIFGKLFVKFIACLPLLGRRKLLVAREKKTSGTQGIS